MGPSAVVCPPHPASTGREEGPAVTVSVRAGPACEERRARWPVDGQC